MELRGHENAVEVVIFAPLAAYAAIRELAGIPVSIFWFHASYLITLTLERRILTVPNDMACMLLPGPETRPSNFGTHKADKCYEIWQVARILSSKVAF
jgi:hypothetical protein